MNLIRFLNYKKPYSFYVCGSKSLSNRYLICLFLCSNDFLLFFNLSKSEDIKVTVNFLLKNNCFLIKKQNKKIVFVNECKINHNSFFFKNAGTALRPLVSIIAFLTKKRVFVNGNISMQKRPIFNLVYNLSNLGCNISYFKNYGSLPLIINKYTKKHINNFLEIDCCLSSQFASSLIICLSKFVSSRVRFCFFIKNLISNFYIDLTIRVLFDFNVFIKKKNNNIYFFKKSSICNFFSVKKNYIKIETDLTSSSYFFYNSLINKRKFFLIKNICALSFQGEINFLNVLKKLGLKYVFCKNSVIFFCLRKFLINNLSVDCKDITDSSIVLSNIIFSFSKRVKLFNIKSWNYKETNRIFSIFNEHLKIGSLSIMSRNWINIKRKKVRKIVFLKTYNDHRMAMVFSSLFFFCKKVYFLFPRCVKKTFNNYYFNFLKFYWH